MSLPMKANEYTIWALRQLIDTGWLNAQTETVELETADGLRVFTIEQALEIVSRGN